MSSKKRETPLELLFFFNVLRRKTAKLFYFIFPKQLPIVVDRGKMPLLRFSASLSARSRAALHAAAEEAGVSHVSKGEGSERRLEVGDGIVVNVSTADDEASLCKLFTEHFGLDPAPHFLAAAKQPERDTNKAKKKTKVKEEEEEEEAKATARSIDFREQDNDPRRFLSPSAFAAALSPLLELERNAEADAARSALAAGADDEAAQARAVARGNMLRPLKVEGAEGGLLGRTLLTLVSARGSAAAPSSSSPSSSSSRAPLPAHRFSLADLVEIRLAKSPASDPPLASGVASRLRDESLTLALDEPPGDELSAAAAAGASLRADRLANDVTHMRLAATVASLAGSDGKGSSTSAAGLPLLDLMFGDSKGRRPLFDQETASFEEEEGQEQGDEEDNGKEDAEAKGSNSSSGGSGSGSGGVAQQYRHLHHRFTRGLDPSQRRAVDLALRARDLALIHGPPGTGKSTTLVALVRALVARGQRVLVCAPSNVAVDTLVERLVAAEGPKFPVVRVGHPARLLPSVLCACLEARVMAADASGLAADARAEAKAIAAKLLRASSSSSKAGSKKGGAGSFAVRRAARAEMRALQTEAKKRDAAAVREALRNSRVVATTLASVGGRSLSNEKFDVAVVDEAAQATEPAAWAAVLRARVCVLAGDHKQLAPTVISAEAAKGGLSVTLFERAHARFCGSGSGGENDESSKKSTSTSVSAASMLTTQYRMHRLISDWSSQELYGGSLRPDESVAEHTLTDLIAERRSGGGERGGGEGENDGENEDADDDDVLAPLLLLDTSGCGCDEVKGGGGISQDIFSSDSTSNPREAAVAMAHVQRLLKAGVKGGDCGVIAPYAAQVSLLRELRADLALKSKPADPDSAEISAVEISTVDGFQGREKEAIVVSATRSNESGEVGFLADARRMNVAVTRARRHVCLVCDADCVGKDAFLRRLVEYFSDNGVHESAQSLLDECE